MPGRCAGGGQRTIAPGPSFAACAFVGARTAWLGAFVGEDASGSPHAVLLRTTDGGSTWTSSMLGAGEPRYTTWAGGPRMMLRPTSAMAAEVAVVDLPQHHNGHRRTTALFVTQDGARSWRLARLATECLDAQHHCDAG